MLPRQSVKVAITKDAVCNYDSTRPSLCLLTTPYTLSHPATHILFNNFVTFKLCTHYFNRKAAKSDIFTLSYSIKTTYQSYNDTKRNQTRRNDRHELFS